MDQTTPPSDLPDLSTRHTQGLTTYLHIKNSEFGCQVFHILDTATQQTVAIFFNKEMAERFVRQWNIQQTQPSLTIGGVRLFLNEPVVSVGKHKNTITHLQHKVLETLMQYHPDGVTTETLLERAQRVSVQNLTRANINAAVNNINVTLWHYGADLTIASDKLDQPDLYRIATR